MGCPYKEGGRDELEPIVSASVENPDLVCQESGDPQGSAHSRLAECGSRQAIQIRSDHPNRVVSSSRGLRLICNRWHQPQIDLFTTKFNNKLPQFGSQVPDSLAWAVHELSLPWEDLDPYAFPPVAILGKVVAN